MGGFFRRCFASLVIGATAVTFAGAPTAGAVTPHAHSASFVGTYKAYVNSGGGFHKGTLTVNADGTDHDQFGYSGTWSNKGKTITFSLEYPGIFNEVFTGKQTPNGLCAKKKPCTYTYNGAAGGTWYAIKKP
jgi:hypothetical protein